MTQVLRFILGDQLSPAITALEGGDRERDVVLMVEVADETAYVRHHKQKIALILAAMRAFAEARRAEGWRVDYVKLDDPENTGSFTGELLRAIARLQPTKVVATQASEHRVQAMQREWATITGLPCDIRDDARFICSPAEFRAWAGEKTTLRMEFFYREMRRKTGLLMDGDEPVGGRWNFDSENRKPAQEDLFMPAPMQFDHSAETEAVLALVEARFGANFGDLRPFVWGVTAADAHAALTRFLDVALPRFGDYQDAMLRGQPHLYHAVISPYLNLGLLDPLAVCRAAEARYRAGLAPLNAVEGFIRQIIGWREYVRGIYALGGADYVRSNALGAVRALPDFYWTGETDMACMASAIGQTKRLAYAHHIQRLMVTGNFALIAGLDPHAVHEWYLAVYADAFEWVEAPNTVGMSLFADGGMMASKPYAASGAYIDRMSDYCAACAYDVKSKTGPTACPFNYLYWDFVARNHSVLARNPRMAQIARSYATMDESKRAAIAESAKAFLGALDHKAANNAERRW